MCADTVTTHYSLIKPELSGSPTTWGVKLNNDLDIIDTQLFTARSVATAPNVIVLNTPAGGPNAYIIGQVGGVNRWGIAMPSNEPETGANVGSNFLIQSFDDSGALLTNAIEIIRATGQVDCNGLVSLQYGFICPNYYGHAVQIGWDGTHLQAMVDGTAVGPISGWSSGGTITGNIAVTGNVTAGGRVAAGQYTITGASFSITASAVGATIQMAPGWTIQSDAGAFGFNSPGGELAEMDNGGNFVITGQAYKPGGGSWQNSSDARTKTVERPYALGLDEVLKLEPIVYRYRGNDAEPGKKSRFERVRDQLFVGLVAQDVEAIFPGMVTKRAGYVDGKAADDLRDLDSSELLYALVNAVKTLAARVTELEAR